MPLLTLPKKARLLKRKQFLYVTRTGSYCRGSQVSFHVALTRYPFSCRLGITVSKKFGKANERNYFKRLVREAFRHVRHELPSCQIIVSPNGKLSQPDFHKLILDFKSKVPELAAKLKQQAAKKPAHHPQETKELKEPTKSELLCLMIDAECNPTNEK